MKRDDDLVREMLLGFETQEDWLVLEPQFLNMSSEERKRYGHIQLMIDAGLMAEVGDGTFRISFQGHDYISAIRSDNVWAKTKEGAAKVGGMTLGMMKDLAIAYVKQEAAEKLGIQL